jgi:hypothetical protein
VALRLLGNAVVPRVAEMIGRALLTALGVEGPDSGREGGTRGRLAGAAAAGIAPALRGTESLWLD